MLHKHYLKGFWMYCNAKWKALRFLTRYATIVSVFKNYNAYNFDAQGYILYTTSNRNWVAIVLIMPVVDIADLNTWFFFFSLSQIQVTECFMLRGFIFIFVQNIWLVVMGYMHLLKHLKLEGRKHLILWLRWYNTVDWFEHSSTLCHHYSIKKWIIYFTSKCN